MTHDPTRPSLAGPTPPGRTTAARVLLSRRQVKAALRLNPAAARRITLVAAVQAGLSATAALLLAHSSPWPHLAGYVALGALASLFGRFEPTRRRAVVLTVVGALLVTAVTVTSLTRLASPSLALSIIAMAGVAGLVTAVCLALLVGAPGPVIIVFAAGASLGPVTDLGAVGQRTLAVTAGALLGLIVCLASDRARPYIALSPSIAAAGNAAAGNSDAPLPSALRRLWIPAGRVALAATVAGLVAHAAGWPHPAWASIGATAVLQGTHLHIHMDRALQRASGTAVGALLAWPLLLLDMPFWALAVTVGALQLVTELIIGRSYAVGQMAITPMALLLTQLASPSTGGSGMPVERVLETVLGVVVGMVVALVLSDQESRHAAVARHTSMLSSISVTSAATGDRSERVSVTCAKSG